MYSLMGQVLIWFVVAFLACLFVAWLVWRRRLKRFEIQLSEQRTMYEYCVTECRSLRQEISELRASESGNHGDSNVHSGTSSVEGDDLTRIKGIGPKLNRFLNELGICSYSQLAELTNENIEWLDSRLHFKGRIRRENWVGQASILKKDDVVDLDDRSLQARETPPSGNVLESPPHTSGRSPV